MNQFIKISSNNNYLHVHKIFKRKNKFFSGNESSSDIEENSDGGESDLEALRKLSLPTNNEISTVADVIEQATRQSQHKVS